VRVLAAVLDSLLLGIAACDVVADRLLLCDSQLWRFIQDVTATATATAYTNVPPETTCLDLLTSKRLLREVPKDLVVKERANIRFSLVLHPIPSHRAY
jgi:hypothetical protein